MALKIPLLMGNGLVITIETQLCVSHMRLVGQRYRWKMRVDSYLLLYLNGMVAVGITRMAGFLLISLNSLK